MNLSQAFAHILNLLAPGLAVAIVTAGLTKILWRRRLGAVTWRRLAAWGCFASMLVLVGGVFAFGRDGAMATYGAMLLANAVAIWWTGFARSAGRA